MAELTERIRKLVMASVSDERFVGIAHDMCKDMDEAELLETASRDGNPILKIEKARPALLHGRAAAVLLKEDWGVEDPDILEAVANHTFGKAGMGDLAKLLYVADKIEPGREQVTEEYTARLMAMTINGMTAAVVAESMEYLKGKGKKVAAETLDFYNSLV